MPNELLRKQKRTAYIEPNFRLNPEQFELAKNQYQSATQLASLNFNLAGLTASDAEGAPTPLNSSLPATSHNEPISSNPSDFKEILKKIYSMGNYDQAILEAKKYLENNPNDLE